MSLGKPAAAAAAAYGASICAAAAPLKPLAADIGVDDATALTEIYTPSQCYNNALLAFLPARRYASAGNSDRNVSVRLSRAGIVSKRRKLAA